MYPAAPVVFTGASPGDALQASTYYNSSTGNYSLVVTDLTQSGAGVSETIKCAGTCQNSSAEVVSEAPGGGPPAYGLADYGAQNYTTVGVTSRSGTKGTLAANKLWSSDSIKMVSQLEPRHAVHGRRPPGQHRVRRQVGRVHLIARRSFRPGAAGQAVSWPVAPAC